LEKFNKDLFGFFVAEKKLSEKTKASQITIDELFFVGDAPSI
jgi:hypothetical protein